MEQHGAGLVQGNEGDDHPSANTATKFGSGLHESSSEFEARVGNAQQADTSNGQPIPEQVCDGTPEAVPESLKQQAFVGDDGQVHEVPPELIGPDGKMLPFTEKTVAMLRNKYFTVRHVLLKDCGHRLDMINFPKRNCQNCLFQWFNCHAKLVETAHEFYQQYGKERLIAMRGEKFVKAFLMFMSTVHYFLEQQKEQEKKREQENSRGVNDPSTETTTKI